ncbi:hypothetical protein D9C73_028049 [Collichthys lucidus]|uniref:Uncharacterized protein n=1 Tax=Collichthys lucidus TaxID=240159 RepID=A0A4V6APF3_COLLU|nr:hypothetical protein D9C73_028049 [Collichthys lucidus]
MSKVQRLLQQGHDEWYVERRDLYHTLLYEAHTAGSASSQKGILSFARAAATYTPLIAPSPLPSARVLRRAHLIMEIEKMPMYRHQLLSVTGEILCIDGTRKALKKIYGDGQGTMQYVTSVLNELGQFVTTAVVVAAAAESEGCYACMPTEEPAIYLQERTLFSPVLVFDGSRCLLAIGNTPVLKKLYGDGQGTMQYVTSVLNEWGQFVTTAVVVAAAAESEGFYARMARGLIARFRRANAPAPKCCIQTTTAVVSPRTSTPVVKKTLHLPSPPQYVIYTDTELELARKHHFEMACTGREGGSAMSKELRCRLVRNTVTSMISILRASHQGEELRYPSKHEVTAMAKRLVEYYPMLQDEDESIKHMSMYSYLQKRILNVKTPQKKQGPRPERSSSTKRRHTDFSPSDQPTEEPAIYLQERTLFSPVLVFDGSRCLLAIGNTPISDRLNAVSMSKVQRLLQQGHDEWYVERRDLYHTLLYEAHTAGSASSQKGILSFARAAATYTPLIAPSPLPSARVLRRAHLIMEIEKMPMYRHQLLSVTGEILCIDGTRKALKKIYGDGQGTMQYVTSVLNEWGQFVTTAVVVAAAAESEGCYACMARGLIARFRRANAPGVQLYVSVKVVVLNGVWLNKYRCRRGSNYLEGLHAHLFNAFGEPTEEPAIYLQERTLFSPVLVFDGSRCLLAIGNTPTEVLQDSIHERDTTGSYKRAMAE